MNAMSKKERRKIAFRLYYNILLKFDGSMLTNLVPQEEEEEGELK
jgi:hypothetical protein